MMEGWKEVKLKEVTKLIGGYAFKSKYFSSDKSVPIIKIKSLKDRNLIIEGGDFVDDEFLSLDEKYHINYNDIVIALTGSHITLPSSAVGRVAKSRHEKKLLLNQRVGKFVVKPNVCDHDFLYYILITDFFFESIGLRAKGAANQANISGGDVLDIKIHLPPLPTQRKIASILSAYDDLIENNLKRIQLLEEQAQLTYEEWFVRFKFPGHEEVEFVDGLPEGWERKLLGDFVDVLKGKNITKATIAKGDVPVVAGGLSPAYYHNKPNTTNPVITVSASGANAGYVNLYLEDIWASDCSYIDSEMTDFLYYIYSTLINQQGSIFHLQHGAAQPHVYPKDLKKIEIVVPPSELIIDFEKIISRGFNLKRNLQKQNQLLKEARDILLPRLMSGMIDVETLLGETAQKSTAPNQSKVRKLNPDTAIEKRKAIAAYIILESEVEEQFGKVKFEKLLHLSEFHAVCGNYERNYKKFAAGPLDTKFTYAFLNEAEKNNLITYQKMGKLERIRVGDKEKLQEIVAAQLDKETQEEIKETVRLFLGSNYEKPEMVSTLYAVWNNRIIKNEMINDELIKKDFFEWDDNKKKYKGKLDRELTWMRKHGVVPEGWGEVI